jgi:7-carboxy-7-deazaguanine synthase
MKNSQILVSEVFGPTIQGEGALAGRVTVFVRTGGCDFKCVWCDTPHAVLPCNKPTWTPQTPEDIFNRVYELTCGTPCLVTLSGGNPALQPLEPLLDWLHRNNYTSAMETQGTVARDWFVKLDHLILSPKPPSSRMRFNPAQLTRCIDAAQGAYPQPKLSLKVVVMDEGDYQFARYVHRAFASPLLIPFYLTPGNHTPPPPDGSDAVFDREGVLERTRWLVARAAEDRWHSVSIIPQLHTLLWANQQGV